MIRDEIRTFEYASGELQRVRFAVFDSLSELDFFRPAGDRRAFDRVTELYARFIVPYRPEIFGQLVLFRLPEDFHGLFPADSPAFGRTADPLTAAAFALRKGVRIIGGKPVFRDESVRAFWRFLEERDSVRIVRGLLPGTAILPVGDGSGFLSESEKEARLRVNSSFFIMDRFDCASPYDTIGTPIGLMVRDGTILNPPAYSREALLCRKDGRVSVEVPELTALTVEIGGKRYRHGENATFYTRPGHRKSPRRKGTDLVIVGRRVAAVKDGGGTPVPASGFVLALPEGGRAEAGAEVVFSGMEDVAFGIQVGNSILIDGKKTERFRSPFFDIRKVWTTAFPPSLYPLDFDKARAPRIALGADREGHGMIAWLEGRGKFPDPDYRESCGASLKETAEICAELGMYNAVHLDGGGSAQLLVGGVRSLRISDRDPETKAEAERAVPAGLIIR